MKNSICFFDKKQDGFTGLQVDELVEVVELEERWRWFLRLSLLTEDDKALSLWEIDREVDRWFKFDETRIGLNTNMKHRIKSDEFISNWRKSWLESFALVIVDRFGYSQYLK